MRNFRCNHRKKKTKYWLFQLASIPQLIPGTQFPYSFSGQPIPGYYIPQPIAQVIFTHLTPGLWCPCSGCSPGRPANLLSPGAASRIPSGSSSTELRGVILSSKLHWVRIIAVLICAMSYCLKCQNKMLNCNL